MRITIKNFKSIGHAELELGPVTFLIGPPASGKSNIMDAIALAGYFNRYRHLFDEYGGSPSNLEPITKIGRMVSFDHIFRYFDLSKSAEVSIKGGSGPALRIKAGYFGGSPIIRINDSLEIAWENLSKKESLSAQSIHLSIENLNKRGAVFYEARLYGYDRYALSQPGCSGEGSCGFPAYASGEGVVPYPKNVLSELGRNVTIHTKRLRDLFVAINTAIAQEMNEKVEVKVLRNGAVAVFDYDVDVGLDSASDALLRTIYYLAALRTSINYAKIRGLEGSMIVMLEEPAAHVFPFLISLMAKLVAWASSTVRVVISTHNPLMVSAVWDKVRDVRTYYVFRDRAGSTNAVEIDVRKLAEDLVTADELLTMRVREVVRKYSKG